MAEKRSVNKLLIVIVSIAIVMLILVMFGNRKPQYQPITELPAYDNNSKPKDADTQSDTIKALQAYTKEAINKAESLNKKTESNIDTVLENKNKVGQLEQKSQDNLEKTEQNIKVLGELKDYIKNLEYELKHLKDQQQKESLEVNAEGLPVGFGFEDRPINIEQGEWYNPIDFVTDDDNKNSRFSSLFSKPVKRNKQNAKNDIKQGQGETEEEIINPVYTLPKDIILSDAIALTAIIGRIPVNGQTPDPYPLKILIGKENLAANGLELPDIEGMMFSGLAYGDWNLSCIRARLYSATYIFSDGRIVNHSEETKPLAHITDPYGNCVAGKFITNAPKFLTQRALLGGLSAAGAAYADAQIETERSSLTGNTTSRVVGSVGKKVLGEVIEDTTDEISQWWLERQKQSFDAVVVNPGASVSVHIDKALAIDHKQHARKVKYVLQSKDHSYQLD